MLFLVDWKFFCSMWVMLLLVRLYDGFIVIDVFMFDIVLCVDIDSKLLVFI